MFGSRLPDVQATVFSLFAVIGSWAGLSLGQAAADESLPQGWAAYGEGTTGGRGGRLIQVSDANQLITALAGDHSKIIQVIEPIELSQAVRVTSNTTLVGVGKTAKIKGGGLHLRKVHNVILRNLEINEAPDAIGIEESHHVWVDHCDLSQCQDGLLDIKRGSDFITVSWNHFHHHHKTCLLGHSDKDAIREMDRGHLRVTYHHNFFDGTQTRHPRVRFADGVEVVNNYYYKNEYGVASLMDAGVIVEGNVFEQVQQPTVVVYGDSPDPGRLVAQGNLVIQSGEVETRGVVERNRQHPAVEADPVDRIRELVKLHAGVHRDESPKKP